MLYIFTGTNHKEVKENVFSWKSMFIEKHGDFNLTHIKNLGEIDLNFLSESLLSNSLFSSKKLIIIEIDDTEKKNVEGEQKKEFLLSSFEKLSEDTIVVLCYTFPDRRSKFYKNSTKLANTIKIYDVKTSQDLLFDLQNKYKGIISSSALSLLVKYKSEHYGKIVSEIEKLNILYSFIEDVHVKENITPELEDSIFTLVNAILQKNTKLTFQTLKILSETTNIYMIYNSLIANLRTTYYISLLKSKKYPPQIIKDELQLGKRGFLVDKSHSLSFEGIQKLYKELVILDRKMKMGEMIGSEENDFLFEIRKALITIMK